jgi:hypothetical protein
VERLIRYLGSDGSGSNSPGSRQRLANLKKRSTRFWAASLPMSDP